MLRSKPLPHPLARRQCVLSLALVGALTSCHAGLHGSSHILVGATLIRPGQAALSDVAIEITGERFSAIYSGNAYPHDEPVIDLHGRYVMAGMTDSLTEMSTQCEANEALRHGITSVVGTAGLDRGPINLDLRPSPVIYPMALIQSRRYGVVFTNDQLDQQLDAAPSNSDGIRFVDFNKDMNNEQMRYLLDRLHDRTGTKINAELANADYHNASGVQALLHTEWYFDPLAPDAVRALPNLQTNAAPLLNWYVNMDVGAPDVTTYSSYLSSNFTLIPALGLYSFHSFPSFASFNGYYDANNVCGIPMTRMSQTAFDNYATSGWAEALYNLERVNASNHPRYLAASATPRFGTLPGVSLLDDLDTLVSFVGLTNDEALAAATTNFEATYGLHQVGKVEPGFYANLIVLDENPQQDLHALRRSIRDVWVKGTDLHL